MKSPGLPPDEEQRLKALQSLDLLDTPPAERFDRVTRLAKRLFNVPIALVSLVDARRQWFKSRQGLDAVETPRDISFCGHAILGKDIHLVNDATKDERFRDNPLVTGKPGIRFYAGYPLRTPEGSAIGTLCIIDCKPRQLGEPDLQMLRDLGAMVDEDIAAMARNTVDEVTRLSNRRGFSAMADKALAFCGRHEIEASLLAVELDGFRQINERFGAAEGDRALCEFSQLLCRSLRDSDIVGRTGPDAFCALLMAFTAGESSPPLRRLEETVQHRNQQPGILYPLAYHHSIAVFDLERHTFVHELLAIAERELHDQKRGRARQSRGRKSA